jgi:hypothetical protein
VALLPFIEQANLYNLFKKDEAWDSEHNKPLSAIRIKLFLTGAEPADSGDTFYQFFAGEGTVMDPATKVQAKDVTDGFSNTLGVVEAGPAVPWAKPADILFHPKKALPKLVGPYLNVFHAATLDGGVHQFKPNMDEELLRQLILRADGNVIDQKKRDAARAEFKANSEEEKKAYTDAHNKLKELAEKKMKLINENTKLNNDLRKLHANNPANADQVFDALEELLREIQSLEHDNRLLQDELSGKKTPPPQKAAPPMK